MEICKKGEKLTRAAFVSGLPVARDGKELFWQQHTCEVEVDGKRFPCRYYQKEAYWRLLRAQRFVDFGDAAEITYDEGGYKFKIRKTDYGAIMTKEDGQEQKIFISDK